MATPLGTTSFTDEEVVVQSDVNLAGTTVEILIIEFDQAKYEDLLSFGSRSPKAMCKICKASKKECSPWGLNCSHSPLFEGEKPQRRSSNQRDPELRVSTMERQPRVERSPQWCVIQTKRRSQDRVSQIERSLQWRVNQIKRRPQVSVPKPKRSPQGRVSISKRGSQDRVSSSKRETQDCVSKPKRSLQGRVPITEREPQGSVSPRERSPQDCGPSTKRSPQRRVLSTKRSLQGRVPSTKRSPQRRVFSTKRSLQGHVPSTKRSPQGRVFSTKCSPQGRIFSTKRSLQGRVPSTKRSPQGRVLSTKCSPQGRVLSTERSLQGRVPSTKRSPQRRVHITKRSPQGRVPTTKRSPQGRVPTTKHDPRVYNTKRDDGRRVFRNKHDPKINVSQVSDLRELLLKDKSTQEVANSCQCERLIATVLSECCASTPRRSIFKRLTDAIPLKRRRRSHKRRTSENEYPGVTINMVSTGGSSDNSSDESEASCTPSVKEISSKFEGIYQRTRTRQGVIPPVNYQRLAKGLKPDDQHSAIAESQSSSSFEEHERAVHMADGTEDLKKRLEEYQAVMQENMRLQQEALRSQQESIDQIRDMMAQIIADRAQFQMSGPTPQPESSRRRSRSSKRKEKVSEASDQETHHTESSFEEEKRTGNEQNPQSAKMRELEARLNAMANRCELQNQGVVRPYPVEWDTVPYPSKFKIPTLQAFDGTGSPNQHIYHFKSQTGNAMSNDAILVRLFIGTLKGVAFEWFMKLPTGCIQKWADLERLFLSRFFEDDTEISVTSLLAIKQKEGEPIKAFVERFRSMALRCSTGMTQSALIDTCRHNLQTNLLARMGVVKCHSWKQLVSQGEQAEVIIARIEAEEEETNSEDQAIDDSALNCEADSENSDSINLE